MTTLACFGEDCLRVSEGTAQALGFLMAAVILFLLSKGWD